ncbi:succinate dehydrogenase, cytochrome b556 subunit [Phytohalomonas tamaricis]|uniref:succinate dehydrogenase, cytochrome b556 subunit n=1 Tax=Phytohalomonas tamaricis TaxID=2081032 RepID=UPI0021D47DC1|nr:succinate dehydrogenase, cytochrome b556 subunit [Phytohalomonas tamaricis]
MSSKRPIHTIKRPVNLDLSSIQFPLPALVSISHRVTGVIMFVGLAFMLWAFSVSLSSPQGFEAVKDVMTDNALAKLITWGLLASVAIHFVAGIRHLFMDMHVADTLEGGQRTAQITMVASAVLVILAGVWVW